MLFNFRPTFSPRTAVTRRQVPAASPTINSNLHTSLGKATVDETIQPGRAGRVRFQGSWWPAQCDQPAVLLPGGVVRVIGISNITLLVEPA